MKNIKKQKQELIEEFNKPENQLPIKIFIWFLIADALIVFLVLLVALVRWFI